MLLHDIHFICYNVDFRGSFKTIIKCSETIKKCVFVLSINES